jgi:hypothetical protein
VKIFSHHSSYAELFKRLQQLAHLDKYLFPVQKSVCLHQIIIPCPQRKLAVSLDFYVWQFRSRPSAVHSDTSFPIAIYVALSGNFARDNVPVLQNFYSLVSIWFFKGLLNTRYSVSTAVEGVSLFLSRPSHIC